MGETYKLNELRSFLETMSYPISKADAGVEAEGVTLQYADGEEPLDEVLDRVVTEGFETVDELEGEIFNTLPTEAVGEPGQAEGEG